MEDLNSRLDQFFGAPEAGPHCCVDLSTGNRHTDSRCRQQGVLLCMNTDADVIARSRHVVLTMAAPMAAPVLAILHPIRGPVVSSRDNASVLHQYRSDETAQAIRAQTHSLRNPHEVLVRAETLAALNHANSSSVA